MTERAIRAGRRPGPLALIGGIALSVSVAGMAGAWVELSGRDAAEVAIEIHYSHFEPSVVTVPLGVPVTVTIHNGDPIDHVFAAGEIMSGNVLTSGYLAGFGMTIGSVWGRIAGRSAAEHAQRA